MKKIFRTCF